MNQLLEPIFSGSITMAGLVLVFLGFAYSTYGWYDRLSSTTPKTRKKLRTRMWAVIGLLAGDLALVLVSLAGLAGLVSAWIVVGGFVLLLIALPIIAILVTLK